MMRQSFFYALVALAIACPAAAQSAHTIDSLLLDAQYDKAATAIDAALAGNMSTDDRLVLQNKRVEALVHAGRFAEADAQLQAFAPQAATAYQRAITQTTAGLLYLNQGRNDRALTALQNALSDFASEGKENTLEAAHALAVLGNLYRATGKNAQAEEQLLRVLAIRRTHLPADSEWIAAAYNDLGLVYINVDADKALDYYEKALDIYQRLHGSDHAKIAIANTNTAFAYTKLELYGDAINNYESALKTWEKVYPQPHPAKGFVLFNLGQVYNRLGNGMAARGYYERALAMYETSYGKRHPDLASVLNALGTLDASTGKLDDALTFFQRALQANVSGFDSNDLDKNPSLSSFYNGNTLLYSLLNKAQALETRYFGRSLKQAELELALRTLQVADTLIDRLRQQISNENDKLTLGAVASDVYAHGVRIAYETGMVALKKKPWYALSFYFAEKSKSAVLLESISDVNAKSYAGIPDNLLEQERTLRSAIALTARQLAQKPTEAEERNLRETAFALNRSYENFSRQLETNYPQYFNLKFNAASPSISQLQATVDASTAVLSYFIDDKDNHLYTFVVTKKKFTIERHVLPAAFDKYITGLRNALVFNEPSAYKRSAEMLSKLLVPQRLGGRIHNLVVLPTGRLSIVPFETLVTKKIKVENSFAGIPYLLRRYSIRYDFSASLILQKAKAKPNVASSIFLCAPVSFNPDDNLPDLPGSAREVQAIGALFASRNLREVVYLNAEADEQTAKSNKLKEFAYLHFATHGIVDETNPELSRIYLRTASAEDGNLFTGEIYNLELNASLVTLSACQTGLGKISKGEGVIGLSRALVYAGAKNIIVSFWSVADESTAQLMVGLYHNILDKPGRTYAESLRDAKLSLMTNAGYESPYFWAPFVLIGF